jgi:anaerobic magnesium-protoporphyrin IX monomethyl ester cyclase
LTLGFPVKILLIYPYFIEERIQAEDIRAIPLGLYSVAAVLKERGYNANILDWHEIHKEPERIRETLAEQKPDVIGFSILHGNRWGGLEIAHEAKELDSNVKIVFGGIGATFLWEHLLKHFPQIDFVILGEGEYSFLNLVKELEKPQGKDFDRIPGIAFRKRGEPAKTADGVPIRNLDELPIPAKYFSYQHVSSSRGCVWNCTFCGSPQFWGKGIRFRSPPHFVEELEMLYRKGVTFFYVSDDTFTIDKKRVIEICKRIMERRLRITWYAISRVNYVDGEMLAWMRKAGCIQISYGVESGSEKIRKRLNKRIKTAEIKRAFALTAKYGILPRAYFIYGSPGETWETVRETIDLMMEIKPLSAIFYILDIFPGTELYSDLKKNRGVTDDIWLSKKEGVMYFETDPTMSEDLILAFGQRLRTVFYENVHSFAHRLSLVERKDLLEAHSEFCSRLGMTFSHGDYARIELVKNKEGTAEELFVKSLEYFPDRRAYLGLGLIRQKSGRIGQSIEVLLEGLRHWPESEELSICLGINYMNLRELDKALSLFSKFPDSKVAMDWAAECRRVLGGSLSS